MGEAIKAIETSYDGHRFRSRAEARWAVFFNAMGIAYRYEEQGFQLGELYYLPDFWLPQFQAWIEIKGAKPSKEERDKACALAHASGLPVYLFASDWSPRDGVPKAAAYQHTRQRRHPWSHLWTACPWCGALGLCPIGYVAFLPCTCLDGRIWQQSKTGQGEDDLEAIAMVKGHLAEPLLAAFKAAKSARFEHGESG